MKKSLLVTRLWRDLGMRRRCFASVAGDFGAPAAAFFCAFSLRSSAFSASRRRMRSYTLGVIFSFF